MLVVDGNVASAVHQLWVALDAAHSMAGDVSDCAKLAALLERGDDTQREFALRYMTHLVAVPQNRKFVPHTRLMPLVAGLVASSSSGAGVLEMGVWVLASLAALDENRPLLRAYRALPPLARLLRHHERAVHRQAMVAWSALLKGDECRAIFKELDGVEALVERLEGGDAEMAEMALTVLCQAGFDEASVVRLVDANMMRTVVALLESGKGGEKMLRMAIIVLAALSTCKDGRAASQLREAAGVRPLVRLLSTSNPFVVEKALMVLSNVAVNSEENVAAMREFGCLQAVAPLMNAKFDGIRSMAVMAATNLLLDTDSQEAMLDVGGFAALVARLADANDKIQMRAAWGIANATHTSEAVRVEVGKLGGVEKLVELVKAADRVPLETRKQALKALVNLALSYDNEDRLLESGATTPMLQYLMLPDPTLQLLAIMALVNLSTGDVARKQVRALGGLDIVVQTMLGAQSGELQLQCLKLITNLSMNGRNRWLLKSNATVVHALRIFGQAPVAPIKHQADMAGRNLSFPCDPLDQMDERAAAQVQQQRAASSAGGGGGASTGIGVGGAMASVSSQQALASAIEEQTAKVAEIDRRELEDEKQQQQQDAVAAADIGATTVQHRRPVTKKQAIQKILTDDAIAQQRQREEEKAEKRQREAEARRQREAKAAAERAIAEAQDAEERAAREAEAAKLAEETQLLEEETEAKYQKKRTNIAVEILVTERSYVESLNMMLKKYMNPMAAASRAKSAVVTEREVNDIFSITSMLHTYHSMLLEGLERRVTQWGPETLIGDYFLQMAEFLRSYSSYINNYDKAVHVLTQCEERPQFAAAFQRWTDSAGELKGKSLYTYLIMPIQRIPRYILLLEDLLKHSRTDHPDYAPLGQAVQKISEIADYVDEKKAFYNDSQRMLALSKECRNVPAGEDIIKPGRIFVLEGVMVVNKQVDTPFYCFLFSDVLLVTEQLASSSSSSSSRSSRKIKRKSSKKSSSGSRIGTGGSSLGGADNLAFNYINSIGLEYAKLTNYKTEAFAIVTPSGKFHLVPQTPSKAEWLNAFRRVLSGENLAPTPQSSSTDLTALMAASST
jgi:RhoGEF domain